MLYLQETNVHEQLADALELVLLDLGLWRWEGRLGYANCKLKVDFAYTN